MRGRRAAVREKGLLHALVLGLSAGLFALVLGLALVLVVVPKAAGATPLTVLTGSMEPRLPPGTLIVVKPTPVGGIHLGDVVTYQIESGRPEVISHRVIEIVSSSDGRTAFVTKGDDNSEPDEALVLPEQVRGTLWYSVPWLGFVNQVVNGDARSWIVPLLAIALLGYAGYAVATGLLEVRRRRGRRGPARASRVSGGTDGPEV
ncbi:signal peptidase I [Frigoribacterium sp. PhB24]|uniref:signal peptidase I n=1 Tax=Frigoribacterium sp. PhB24 TaxID=2485204 RepID=UPI000FB91C25|nr:signal peptidase I [Frigoribacterium sp. PhB24]ROS54760.1 signal peptidase [Frigoribacterium sp. PhB24]